MLEEKYIEKAKRELNEDELNKKNSLEEFRLWIGRSEFFKNCRQDDKFLLQFLRTKKFNLEKSLDLFEKYMLLKSEYPKWYNYDESEREKMWSLFETGFIFPLIDRDEEGRRIIFVQAEKIDPDVYCFADVLRLVTYMAQVLLEEEETQISGFVVIALLSRISLKHVTMFSVSDVVNFVNVIRSSSIGRHKKMILVGMPNSARVMLEVAKKVMSEKLRQRVKLIKDLSELQDDLNISLLPMEIGESGTKTKEDMMRNFKELAEKEELKIKEITDGIDWDKVALECDESSCSLM